MPNESPAPNPPIPAPPSLNAWNKADIVGKILLGIAGLALSIAVAADGYFGRQRENLRKEQEANAAREERLVKEFQTYYGWAHTGRENAAVALLDLDMAGSIAQILAEPPYARTMFRGSIGPRREYFQPEVAAGDTGAGVSSTLLQAKEASAPAPRAPASAPAAGGRGGGMVRGSPQLRSVAVRLPGSVRLCRAHAGRDRATAGLEDQDQQQLCRGIGWQGPA